MFLVARGRQRGTPRNTLVERLTIFSTYPLDCLTYFAQVNPYRSFRDWTHRLFGIDIPIPAVERLYRTLKTRTYHDPRSSADPFPLPTILVEADLERIGRLARGRFGDDTVRGAYGNGVIYLDPALVADARRDSAESMAMLAVLTEEYGHHIDSVLRTVYSTVGGDAKFDEGALFALAIRPTTDDQVPSLIFATDSAGHEYALDAIPAQGAWGLMFPVSRIAADRGALAAGRYREFFAAADEEKNKGGEVHFRGHQGIERVVAERLGWSPAVRRTVYFGNWQRDFSQFGDPKILQAVALADSIIEPEAFPIATTLHRFQQQFHTFMSQKPSALGGNSLMDRISQSVDLEEALEPMITKVRSAWFIPALLDILAEDEFAPRSGEEDETPGLRFPVRDDPGLPYRVGVYVPREHIDNPSTITKGYSNLDDRFRGPYDPAREGGIDQNPASPHFGLRRYIPDSVAYVREMIDGSCAVPPAMPDLDSSRIRQMFFGNALHTIEDYFAHSNFLEVALADRAEAPWAIETWAEPFTADGRRITPIVTGTFGGLDTAMSIVGVICHHLAQEEQIIMPGPTRANRMTLILLRRLAPAAAPLYSLYLELDLYAKLPPQVAEAIQKAVKEFARWIRVQLAWTAAELLLEMMVPRLARMAGKSPADEELARIAIDARDPDLIVESFGILLDLEAADIRTARLAAVFVDIDYQGDLDIHTRDPEKLGEILEEMAGLYQRIAATGTEEPTHTQLGKDHGTHPLHLLATEVAIWAVTKVARPMADIWNQPRPAKPELRQEALAAVDALLRHPQQLDAGLAEELEAIIKAWESVPENRERLRYLERAKADVPKIRDTYERRTRIVADISVLLKEVIAATAS